VGQALTTFLATISLLTPALDGFIPTADSRDEVVWVKEMAWEEVVALASWFQRPILVDFTADWCAPCQRLDEEVFSDPAVAKALRKMLTLKVDVGKPENRSWKQDFLVNSLPTLLLCQPNGDEIDRIVGFRPAPDFLLALQDGLADRNTIADLHEQLREDPFDPFLLLTLGTKHARQLHKYQGRLYLQRAREQDADNRLGVAARALWRLGELERRLGDSDAAIVAYLQILVDYPDSPLASQALPMVAYIQQQNNDLSGMVSTYGEIARRNPQDVSALIDFAWYAAQVGVSLEEATDVALKAVHLSDEDPDVMGTLAMVYHSRGMHQEAISWIKKAIAKEPDERFYQLQLGKFTRAAAKSGP